MPLIALNTAPTPRELRWFSALWFPLMVAVIGWAFHGWLGESQVAGGVWIGGAVLALVMNFVAPVARVVFVGLSYATFPIGFIISFVVLGVTFYLLVTPMGLLMRLFGRDTMQRRFDPQATTYWSERGEPRPSTDYFRQS